MKIFFLPRRQWKLQRERLQADFTKALDNFQRAQRSAAQKEKEAIKKYKNQGVSPLMHKQVVNLKNKRTPLGLGDCSEIQSSYKFLQVPPGEGGGGANLIDIEEGQNKRQVITSCKQIKYDTFISLVFVVSPPLEPNICFPCSQLMLEEEQNLEYLQERERSVAQLEADIGDVNQIFKDLAAMVHDQVMMRGSMKKKNRVFFYQGEMVDSIEANVESASIRVNEGSDQLRMAERYQVRLVEQPCHVLNHRLSCEPAFQVFLFTIYFQFALEEDETNIIIFADIRTFF